MSSQNAPSICFVGLGNLPVLAREYGSHSVGGAELQQTLLAKALARRGVAVSMVVADYGQVDGSSWHGIKTYKAYRPEAGIAVLRFIHPRWTGLWAAMRRADADIYYTMCAGAHLGQIAMFVRRFGRRLVFGTASDTDCDPRALLIRFWRDRQLYRYGLKRADVVLTQTAVQHTALLRNFGRESRIVEALSEPAGRHRDFDERDIDVLWVANIRGLKRPDKLLQLARALPHRRFHMVGGPYPGEQSLFDSIRDEAAALPNVIFHGFVPYHEIGRFFERSRVFVNTSDIEGVPNTYLQAWAHGAPVTAFIDPDRLIERNGLGRAVSSLAEMSTALTSLLRDARQWRRASDRCRSYIDNRFSESRVLAPYLETFMGLLPAAQATSWTRA